MTAKEIFFQDKKNCSVPFTHISDEPCETALGELDELYGAADVLSIQNAVKHRRILLLLAVAGTLLTLAFLLYDEVELHGLIFACAVMILCLFLIRQIGSRIDCHRKYLEYRVLAEAIRVQYFLCLGGSWVRVSDILPWPLKQRLPWINEILSELTFHSPENQRPVLDLWIRDQKNYHTKALLEAEKKNHKDEAVTRTVIIITIIAYLGAVVFELVFYRNNSMIQDANTARVILKILLGTLSAITLLTGSYYGKMSLANVIDDHKRMIALYQKAEEDILSYGENEELLLGLAREALNENSTWFAYQSMNKPDLII